ncbi:hypothetical protein [Tabrizicola fusiformis]|uniref:hypothetical protein n=1 Tax=Tabrizicola sp. SY72 TaxID=2741673 RepID=UPI001571B776|nr:hypothetical protein [Tabrizicola sp. SY72]NTT88246.1 hypothetical protein [Tabrizicola sp. SY72]
MTANLFRRRQIIEDALAECLKRLGDITHDRNGERCLAITVRRCEGAIEQELHSIFSLAREIEVKLS